MIKVYVTHQAKIPYNAAIVNAPCTNVRDALDYAYRWTQNIFDSWSLKMPEDGNDAVTVMGDISGGIGLRSTSVGDQILVGTEKYVVAGFGFETLDGKEVK